MMRKLLILMGLVVTMMSCENQGVEFPDFEDPDHGFSTTGYFPYQYPVRTLILGNYIYDNSNDNNHRFMISAAMGGVYQNQTERVFSYIVDETLCEDAYFGNGDPITPLPANYYTISDPEKIVIPSGQTNGGVTVQLTDDFFNDPNAIKNTYVIPLRIIGALNIDRLLLGTPSVADADRRIDSHWEVLPKDFTLFGVKFVNPYHGSYLMRGTAIVRENGVALEQDSVYQASSVERDIVTAMQTVGRTSVTVEAASFKSRLPQLQNETFELVLNFASDQYDTEGGVACTVEAPEGVAYTATGTGVYTIDGGEFGGKPRDLIEVSYTVSKDGLDYTATDRYVFRDKGIVLETFTPSINPGG